jgi:hypothetical protein
LHRVDEDPSLYPIDELRGNPTDKVVVKGVNGGRAMGLSAVAEPGIPGRNINLIEAAVGPGSALV